MGFDVGSKTESIQFIPRPVVTSLQYGTRGPTLAWSDSKSFSAQLWTSPPPLAAPLCLFFRFISVLLSSANAAIVVVENIPGQWSNCQDGRNN